MTTYLFSCALVFNDSSEGKSLTCIKWDLHTTTKENFSRIAIPSEVIIIIALKMMIKVAKVWRKNHEK